ncbi:Pyrrolo-quinoline quinone [Ectopseudomonas mendocina]|uniref:Ig-like domain-containing protein n=2 Tax=Ectopseudomonas mendocina TaxID=300 RepID=UPI000E004A7C|nr:Ig-like domain-containing protein [Pseudomonas mendocina]SUD36893.1 Pyrrolo-quinoline quinone [Pseudomonas mendocina]
MFWKKTAPVRTAAKPAMSALAMALEPRMMFDGAVAATAAEVADTQAADAQPTADASSSHDTLAATPTGTADNRQEIVFVDGQVQDYQQLLAGIKPGTEVVVLDPKGDGLKQISDYLSGRSGIDAIHIVSHGLPGQVTLGSLALDKAGLDARAADLAQIGQSLDVDGDILFYGCDVGSGAAGQAFVNQIAQLTGADVAASNDPTGSVSQGGDWTLEVTSGSIEAVTPFSASAQQAFSGRLFAGTLNFSGPDAVIGTTVTDGDANSTDIPGVVIEIYSANSGNTNSNSPWEYYSDLFNNGTPDAEGIVDASGDGTPIVIIRSQDGTDFSFTGIKILDYLGAHPQITFEAFRDGISLGSVTLTTDTSDYISDFTQSNGLTASIFQNVDEIRISDPASGDGNLYVGIDNIGFADVPRPALVSATFSDNNLKIGETSTVTFTFNMAVTGFTTTDLTVPNGNISGLSSSDGGLTWTGLFTPNASVTDPANVITVNLAGVNAVSGGLAGTGTADSSNYAIDTLAPSVTSVTSSTANGTYKTGDVISVQVNFGETVTVAGTPQLTLETGSTDRVVNYASGSGTNSLTFTYTVQAGDSAADLDYISTNALGLNGGTIRDAAGNDAILSLATPGTAGSLGANKDIVINSAPGISNLNGDSMAWAGAGNTVVLDVGGNALLSDTEFGALNGGNGNWVGASLTIQRNGTALSSDILGFNTVGALFTISGSNLQSNGQTFAAFTNVGGVLTITFTSSVTAATTALVNDVAQRVTYRNDTPAGDTTIRYSLNDGTSTVTADVVVTSDIIYVTNTNDTATIDLSNGVSFSEAVAIAALDATGSQTIVFASSLAGQTLNLNTVSINESLTFDMDQASGLVLTGGTITLGGGTTQTFTHGAGDTAAINSIVAGSGALTKAGAGELSLSGAGNTFSGGTSISAGTLTVSGGNALSDSGSVSVASGATLALSGNEAVGNLSGAGSINLGNSTLSTNQSADTSFSGTISGNGGLTVSQSVSATYALTLSGSNSYSGATTLLNYGWLKLNGEASISNSSAVQVNGNSVLTLLSDQTIGSLASSAATASIQLGSYTLSAGGDNSSTTVAGVISGNGALIKQGTGTLTLAGNNTYAGSTTVSAGTLSIASDANLGAGSLILAGSTLDISGATTIDNAITLTGNSSIGNASAVTLSSAISGAYDLSKTGSGTLTLSASNSYGATYVNAGTLSVSSDANLGSGAVNLAAGTTLALTGATTIDNAIILGGNATLAASANATVSGVVSGAFTLTKTGASTLTLSGANTYGATTVSAGTLSVASDGNLGSGALTLGAGTTLAVTSAATIDNNIALSGSATVNTGANTTLSGVISGGNNLTKTGASTLTLTGNNTYSGSTSVNTGTLSIASDSNLGTGPLNLANGTILQITGNTTLDNALALTGLVTVNAGAAATLSGTISGTGSLIKAGASNLTLSGSNTNSGTTTVSAGTLVVDGSTASATTVASGATLAGSGTLGGDVTVQSGGTLSPGGAGVATLTVNGNLTLASGSTLALDINGTTAGTGYDRVVVNGTVDVSGAALAVTHGYAAGSGDSYTVIVNDAADAVTGTFSGVSEGSKFNAADNGTELTTSYIGGSGNDLSLTAPIAPTVTSVSSSTANGTYKIGDVITVTVRFDGAVNVTGTPTLTLETGATDRALNYVSGSGTDTLSFSYTVQAGDSSADLDYVSSSALSLNGGTIKDGANQNAILTLAAPGAAGSLGANKALVVDGVRPAATSITLSDSNLRIGETATVTVTFNERVSGLDTADFSVANGTLSGLSSSDGGLTWTATFTPSANISDATNLITLDNTGVMDQAGNIGSGTTDSVNYAIDTQRPTASIVVTDTTLKAGQTTTVTITFSEAVTGLDIADFNVANGILSNLSTSDNITYTATLTPGANVTDTTNLITLDNTGYTDIAGNAGSGSTDSNNYAIDTQRPTATIVVTDTALKAGQGTTVTITFSEAVSGLTTADFSVANGSLSGLSSADGGITWTATLTPSTNVTDPTNLVTLDNTGYTDAAGNTGTGTTDSNNYAIDSQRPTASIVVGNTSLSIGDSTTVTITFSEAVTGLTIADFTVANGALSNLSSNDGGVTWTATLTPSADVASPTNKITLANTGYTDTAGNTGSTPTDSNNYSVDTQRPTATIVVNDTILAAGETTTVTISFNEAVSGLALANFAVANGVLSNLSTSDNITWTATLTPNANTSDATNLITLNNSGVQDQAGNTGVGTTDSNNYAIDTQRPTATSVLVTDTALKAGQSTTVTITFSEAVSGLTTTDFSVANGMLSNLSSSDGGLTWTATLTPDANVTDATNLITLDNTGYADAAGNTGTGITTSNNYTIDTQRPTATIVVNDTALAVGETTAVTITFNEAVTGLNLADFSVANGTLSNLSTTDNITYTAILTPSGNIADSSNVITLNNAGVQDAAGNIGSGSTNSNNYTIDTQRPTATIQLSDAALAAGETATVTITFNEVVTGLSLADLSASNGTLSGLSSNDGGITWTAILTPAANVTASSNLITLNNAGVQDAAGNTGIGGTLSGNYAVDTVVPVIGSVSVPVSVQYNAGDTLTFVVNASEAVLVNGTPRLALDIGGTTVFANYIAGSGTTTLVFQYSVQPGLNDADGITVTGLQSNGGNLRDATGNAMNLNLNNVGDTSGVRIDTTAPTAALALDQAASSAGNVRYTLTFSEDVSGVDLSDFSLVSTGNAQGTLSSLVQIDARTYQITISNVVGSGSLALALNSSGTGISDSAGNVLIGGLVGQPYTQNQTAGDPEFLANPTPNAPTTPSAAPQPNVPSAPPSSTTSPLFPPPLFEQPTLGGGIPPVGNIFINNGALAPSYIAQVFASSDSGAGNGSGIGFLGFGGGDGGVFGTSSFSSMFSKEVPLESGEIQLRWGGSPSNGVGGGEILGAPTLGQQLHEIGESEQRQIRDLAWAFGQISLQAPNA